METSATHRWRKGVKNRRQGRTKDSRVSRDKRSAISRRPFCFSVGVAAGAFLRSVHYTRSLVNARPQNIRQRYPGRKDERGVSMAGCVPCLSPGVQFYVSFLRAGCVRVVASTQFPNYKFYDFFKGALGRRRVRCDFY